VTSRLRLDDGTAVAAQLHLPGVVVRGAAPVLLLPGARGDHAAPHLVALAELLSTAGHPVVRSALSDRPPSIGASGPSERAVARIPQLLTAARGLLGPSQDGDHAAARWIVGGASFGGRVASMAVASLGAATLGVCGVIALAYPLHPPGRPERLRTSHWPGVDVPMLLLSGDADEFAAQGLLEGQVGAITGGATLVRVPGARHDLSVTARRDPDGRRRSPAETVQAHSDVLLTWAATVSG
jgi:predicted alpha/beta-hydrolase family hydrolase